MNREKLIDLDKEQLALLDEIIKRHIPNKPVWAYGSRVTWKASEISDLDLTVFDCDPTEVFNLKEAFVESDLLISVDVMDWESIPEKFKNNIKKKYVVLQGKTELAGWREVKLGEVADINPTESVSKGAKLPKVLMGFLVPFTKRIPKYVMGAYKGGSKFKNGDTLVARITPCLENGKTSFVDFLENGKVGFGSTEFIVLRERKNITNKHFLYYLAISNNFREVAIKSMTGTSGRQRVQTDEVFKYNFSLPPLPEQKAIAEVLSSLDDKIDLLHRQNKTLENIAQTLFRQWFVEDADEDWETNKIPDEFDLTMGQSPPGSSYNESQNGIPMFQGNADFSFRFPKNRIYTTEPKRFAEKFDTLISVRAPVGDQNMAIEKCCIGRGVAAFKYKKDGSFYTYTYFKMMSLMDKVKQFNQEGTVFGSISKSDFENFSITIPPIKLVQTFQKIVKPIDDKIIFNQSQIRTLENLRDTLLPKLMSGTVRVVA